RQVIAGRLDVAHRSFRRVAFEIVSDAVLFAGVPHRLEALDQQLQPDLPGVGNGVAADAAGQRREESQQASTRSRRPDNRGPRKRAAPVKMSRPGFLASSTRSLA